MTVVTCLALITTLLSIGYCNHEQVPHSFVLLSLRLLNGHSGNYVPTSWVCYRYCSKKKKKKNTPIILTGNKPHPNVCEEWDVLTKEIQVSSLGLT